jgi:5-methylcytosine-specific restriction endonuclease McrA
MTHRKDLSESAKQRARAFDNAYNAAHREQQRAWREANKEQLRAKAREYRKKNKERIAAQQAAYRVANAEKLKAYGAAYCLAYEAENRERIAARKADHRKTSGYFERYSKENPERMRVIKQNYRARRRAALGKLSADIVQRLGMLQKWLCVNCRCDLRKVGHHLDHVQPLALGGENSDANVQLLCPRCNTKKKDTDPIEWAQRNGRLL